MERELIWKDFRVTISEAIDEADKSFKTYDINLFKASEHIYYSIIDMHTSEVDMDCICNDFDKLFSIRDYYDNNFKEIFLNGILKVIDNWVGCVHNLGFIAFSSEIDVFDKLIPKCHRVDCYSISRSGVTISKNDWDVTVQGCNYTLTFDCDYYTKKTSNISFKADMPSDTVENFFYMMSEAKNVVELFSYSM